MSGRRLYFDTTCPHVCFVHVRTWTHSRTVAVNWVQKRTYMYLSAYVFLGPTSHMPPIISTCDQRIFVRRHRFRLLASKRLLGTTEDKKLGLSRTYSMCRWTTPYVYCPHLRYSIQYLQLYEYILWVYRGCACVAWIWTPPERKSGGWWWARGDAIRICAGCRCRLLARSACSANPWTWTCEARPRSCTRRHRTTCPPARLRFASPSPFPDCLLPRSPSPANRKTLRTTPSSLRQRQTQSAG